MPKVRSDRKYCRAYQEDGFCLRGEFCPYKHGEYAFEVNEDEFFYEWENVTITWLQYQMKKFAEKKEEMAADKMEEANPEVLLIDEKVHEVPPDISEKKKYSTEQERERVRRNAERRKKEIALQRKLQIEKMLMKSKTKKKEVPKETPQQTNDQDKDDIIDSLEAEIEGKYQPPAKNVVLDSSIVDAFNLPAFNDEKTKTPQKTEDDIDYSKYKDVNFDKPIIPISLDLRIPRVIRQRALDKLVAGYSKKYNRKKAVVLAIEKELELYRTCQSKRIYWNATVNFVKTI